MMNGVSSSRTEEFNHRMMLNGLNSYDKDNTKGLSLSELANYKSDNNQNIPEFAQKLVEKFEQLDANKDGQLQQFEINGLKNNRGLWRVDNVMPLKTKSLASSAEKTTQSNKSEETLLKKLLKEGYEQVKDRVDIKEIVDKII